MSTEPGTAANHVDVQGCWSLLRGVPVGRLAFTFAGQPEIFPVNFTVDHGSVVIRTGPGSKLASVAGTGRVAFECDGYDSAAGEAWSVVLKGKVELLHKMQEVIDTVALPLFPWHAGPKPFFLRLVPEEITGRRFVAVAPSHWSSPHLGHLPTS